MSFNSEAYATTYDWNAQNVWVSCEATMKDDIRALVELLDPQDDSVVVDLGCGTGQSLSELVKRPYKQLIGVEPALEMLKVAQQKFGNTAQWHQVRAEDLRRVVSGATHILSSAVLKYVADIRPFLHAVNSSLTSSGIYVFDIPITTHEAEHVLQPFFGAFVDAYQEVTKNRISLSVPQDYHLSWSALETLAKETNFSVVEKRERSCTYSKRILHNLYTSLWREQLPHLKALLGKETLNVFEKRFKQLLTVNYVTKAPLTSQKRGFVRLEKT